MTTNAFPTVMVSWRCGEYKVKMQVGPPMVLTIIPEGAECCGTCKHFGGTSGDSGEGFCFRYPPTLQWKD